MAIRIYIYITGVIDIKLSNRFLYFWGLCRELGDGGG
jgi:hypothetical protein